VTYWEEAFVKRVITIIVLAIAVCLIAIPRPALADANTLAQGAKVFNANCAACHMGGGNVVSANKTLKQDALQQNGLDTEAAIIAQVTKGKSAMPAFLGRLTDDQIQAVAAYVLDKSAKGW
jgi:cytochrome c6